MSKPRRPQPPQLSPTPPPPCSPKQLTEAREKLWMTPEEFAAYSGYSVKLLARMEAGDKEIPGPMRRIVHTIETRLTPPPPPRSPAQLTAARERFGMTPAEFAAELCVSVKLLARMEAGQKEIPRSILTLLRLLEMKAGLPSPD